MPPRAATAHICQHHRGRRNPPPSNTGARFFGAAEWECVNTVADPEGEKYQRGTETVKIYKKKRLTCREKIKHLTFSEADEFGFFEINGILVAYFYNSCSNL